MRPIYLWQYPTGPKFTWNDSDLITLLSEVRNLEGKIQGMMGGLGFDVQSSTSLDVMTEDVLRSSEIEGVILNSSLDVMTEDVLRSSEIEGVILNSDRVRSSIARHLGIETVGLRLTRTITDMLLAKADGFPLRFYSMSQKFFVKRNHIFVSEGLLLIHILWAISADLQVPMREYAVVALYADASLLQLLLQYFQLSIKLPAFPISCFNVWNTVHNISR